MNSRCFVVTIDDSKQSAKVISLVSVLKSLGRSDDLLSDSYVDDVVEKLPVSLRTKWIDSTKDRPGRRNLESLAERLEDRAHTWDIVQGIADSSRIKAEVKPSYPKPKGHHKNQKPKGHTQRMQRPWWLHVRFISRGAIE